MTDVNNCQNYLMEFPYVQIRRHCLFPFLVIGVIWNYTGETITSKRRAAAFEKSRSPVKYQSHYVM